MSRDHIVKQSAILRNPRSLSSMGVSRNLCYDWILCPKARSRSHSRISTESNVGQIYPHPKWQILSTFR